MVNQIQGSSLYWLLCASVSLCLCGGFFGKGARITLAVERRMSSCAALPSREKGWISNALNDFHSFNRTVRGVE